MQATPLTPQERTRSWFVRHGRVLVTIALLVAACAWAICWANEPNRRRRVLFESPIRLQAGSTIKGAFVPEHDGPYVLELRFRKGDGSVDALVAALGGGYSSSSSDPAGVVASYVIRQEGRRVVEGASRERLTGWGSNAEMGVQLAWIDHGHPVPLDVELRIDRAVESLAAWDARFVVAPGGDWISYSSLESACRFAIVIVGLVVVGVVWLVWHLRRRRLLARKSASTV